MTNRWGNSGNSGRFFFGGGRRGPKSLQMVTAAMKLKMLTTGKESYDQPSQHIKKQRHSFANGFSSGHVWMLELDYKES